MNTETTEKEKRKKKSGTSKSDTFCLWLWKHFRNCQAYESTKIDERQKVLTNQMTVMM